MPPRQETIRAPVGRGVAKIKELRERGMHIRVLTNSLASNDLIAAFAGSKTGLHTKAIVFDRKPVFVGSFNLDAPVRYDTEPMTTDSQRFEASLIRLLPIADQL